MKRFTMIMYISILLIMALTACTSSKDGTSVSSTEPILLVSSGDTSKTYTRADLEALGASQAVFKDITYVGVSLSTLLQNAGFSLDEAKAIKAVAADGYSINYEPVQISAADVIVAYARTDSNLSEEDGSFRIVIPGAEGKMNIRMLVELQVMK